MLRLLIRTRFRYYHNFIRYHFDRRTLIEIGFILLVLLFLLGRSPADIGYSFNFLYALDFPNRWLIFWTKALPFLYIVFEILALLTMRSRGEWHVLGGLPLPKRDIVQYHLFRYTGKTFALLLLGTIPFLFGSLPFSIRFTQFVTALLLLLILHYTAFLRTFTLRGHYRKIHKIFAWIFIEGCLITILILIGSVLKRMIETFSIFTLLSVLMGILITVILIRIIQRVYDPSLIESHTWQFGIFQKSKSKRFKQMINGQFSAALFNDSVFLIRQKRSLFVLMSIETITISILCITYDFAVKAFTSCIFLEIFFSWIFILNMIMILFERDANAQRVLRILPISPHKLWFARWLLVSAVISIPMIAPSVIIPIKFSLSLKFLSFVGLAILGIPALLSMLYCTTGFALFPHAQLAKNILNTSILFMILFWFFMPLGPILLIAVALFWAHKSHKHFQFSEVS